jgi:HD-like signal output (HDOD) protein
LRPSAFARGNSAAPGTLAGQAGAPIESEQAFAFVKELAAAVSRGKIELPSFPAVAIRVNQVLNDDSVSTDRIVKVLGAEPALAARLLRMANSVALNPLGHEIRDLKMAVLRVGLDVLRSAAITFAMSQLKLAREYQGLEGQFEMLWNRSARVAATCYATAQDYKEFRPDEAMLTGLLHGVGRLYILCHASRYPALMSDPQAYRQIADQWSPEIGKAILENWELPDSMAAAVQTQDIIDRDSRKAPDLADVLIVGKILADRLELPEDLAGETLAQIEDLASLKRLRLTPDALDRLMASSRQEIDSLHAALGI